MSSNSNSIERRGTIQKRESHCSPPPPPPRAPCRVPSFHSRHSASFRSTSLTLMMRITSLIRLSFCTKLGRYGTLAPVLQTRLCLPPATTKVSPTVSFCLRLHSPPLRASCCPILLFFCFSVSTLVQPAPPPPSCHLRLITQFASSSEP